MKKYLPQGFIIWTIVILTGCNTIQNGELTGVDGRERWIEPAPYGMNYVKGGSFNIGPNDEEISLSGTPSKTVSIAAFWMDDTEITNNEYRQFVYWVRDSIARSLLSEQFPEFLINEDRQGNALEFPHLNWEEKIEWNNADYTEALLPLYVQGDERFFNNKEIDSRKLIYEYRWIDLKQAARRVNSYDYATQGYHGTVVNSNGETEQVNNRSSFMMRDQTPIFPDTLCWIRDFTFSFNEPLSTRYFWHPAFDNYPVVGIAWKQAKAFCHWRTKIYNDYISGHGDATVYDYRLPTEVEWEYAARGNRELSMFPWGGYYTREQKGDFRANFKPLRGNYIEDGSLTTLEVASYHANDFGLYDMAGNVAEWTSSAFDESAYMYIDDFNPDFQYDARPDDAPALKRKVIRGGSWKDISFYLQTATRSYEYQDTAKSYIGFRCVRSVLCNQFYNASVE
ncbi:MAG TPA: SUMF1/EgtB/PvdO family nonheme iron enzyme [Prolixibacteraceae bacterium]|nr:SUMF1/EgtB/PvdO family nonheme iron enzyme [Prolixibacteraceae bacterium]